MQNKVVIVTGASRGLGRHLALQLADAGARVIACARDESQLAALAAQHPAIQACPLDLGSLSQIRPTIARLERDYGQIDVLINNAGCGLYKDFHEQTPAEIHQQIQVNFVALVELCHAVLGGMRSRRQGHILNIASDLARRPLAKMAVYSAAKHAVAGFSQSLLREVKSDGIKVSLINPGIMDTFFGGGQEGSRDESWALRPEVVAKILLDLLRQPGNTLIDELSLHPLQQDF